jgi:hypothetical protein
MSLGNLPDALDQFSNLHRKLLIRFPASVCPIQNRAVYYADQDIYSDWLESLYDLDASYEAADLLDTARRTSQRFFNELNRIPF